MVVEPFGNDRLEDNLNPIGRVFYAASTMVCVPGSLSQEVGMGLGTQAGETRLTEVLKAGGFTRVRRARRPPSTWSSKRAHSRRFRSQYATISPVSMILTGVPSTSFGAAACTCGVIFLT
jgi:hypothetical protein